MLCVLQLVIRPRSLPREHLTIGGDYCVRAFNSSHGGDLLTDEGVNQLPQRIRRWPTTALLRVRPPLIQLAQAGRHDCARECEGGVASSASAIEGGGIVEDVVD